MVFTYLPFYTFGNTYLQQKQNSYEMGDPGAKSNDSICVSLDS